MAGVISLLHYSSKHLVEIVPAFSDHVRAIFLIFYHCTEHDCKQYTATKERLRDPTLVRRNIDMIDLVYWDGKVYDCDVNYKATDRLKEIAEEQFN